jgi:hypothetical protein
MDMSPGDILMDRGLTAMRIFKTIAFYRWAKKETLSDKALVKAIHELREGNYEANLGGNLFKKRIAISGKGKSGGLRTILAFRSGDKSFFVFGFSKNQKANMTEQEKLVYKKLAKLLLSYNDLQIKKAIEHKEIIEVSDDKKIA